MSSPSANISSLIVLAGFSIAGGVTVLCNYLTNTNTKEEPRGYEKNESSRDQSESNNFQRSRLRAISPPPRQPPARSPPASTSQRRDGVHEWREEIHECPICRFQKPVSRIRLACSHTFHDECYTIWRHMVVMQNPHAKLCPSC